MAERRQDAIRGVIDEPRRMRWARGLGRRRPTGSPALPSRFSLTDEDRAFLTSRRDERRPLPRGAREYLTADNPRLTELRRAYAALATPATDHSQWKPSNVEGYLDLAYFRGDSMIQWHYRELARATRLKMFAYLSYLKIEDDGMLEKLGEDGLFGCWTYEYAGHPPVSRDLLDSVNELRFLDRQLSILGGGALRVLDIGAGYGRLAHRAVAAVPHLEDYCCVDAVPESSFLCEYYLSFRRCEPPARMLPLHQLGTLRPGQFDLAVNVHSFSECPEAAVSWWLARLRELQVPMLFVVPNEPDGFLSREKTGRHDLMPVLEDAGYRLRVREPVISDPAVRDMTRIHDHYHLFELAGTWDPPATR